MLRFWGAGDVGGGDGFWRVLLLGAAVASNHVPSQ